MRGTFHPKKLFAPFKWPKDVCPYEADDEMLDAVRDRTKALFFTRYSRPSIVEGDKHFLALLDGGLSRRLAVIIAPPNPGSQLDPSVSVLHLDQSWRVSALNALMDAAFAEDGRWSLAAEAQMSSLLGYTTKQRARWIKWQGQRRAAYSCMDLYTMLTASQLKVTRKLGMRCFGTPDQMQGMKFFFPRDGTVAQPNAYTLIPKGLTFSRVGVAHSAMQKLFGPFASWKATWMEVLIGKVQARLLTEGLKSNIQILTSRGWK